MGVYHLTHDTPAGESYSVASLSNGEYGIDDGLIFSFPSRTVQGKHEIIKGIQQNEFGQQKIQLTLQELRDEYKAVKDLGLIG